MTVDVLSPNPDGDADREVENEDKQIVTILFGRDIEQTLYYRAQRRDPEEEPV
jgi:hypothetical protein